MEDMRWYIKSVRKRTWCTVFISICAFFWRILNAEKLFTCFPRFLHISLETVRGKSSAAVAWKFVDYMSVWVVSYGLCQWAQISLVVLKVEIQMKSQKNLMGKATVEWRKTFHETKPLNYDITVINLCLIDC